MNDGDRKKVMLFLSENGVERKYVSDAEMLWIMESFYYRIWDVRYEFKQLMIATFEPLLIKLTEIWQKIK